MLRCPQLRCQPDRPSGVSEHDARTAAMRNVDHGRRRVGLRLLIEPSTQASRVFSAHPSGHRHRMRLVPFAWPMDVYHMQIMEASPNDRHHLPASPTCRLPPAGPGRQGRKKPSSSWTGSIGSATRVGSGSCSRLADRGRSRLDRGGGDGKEKANSPHEHVGQKRRRRSRKKRKGRRQTSDSSDWASWARPWPSISSRGHRLLPFEKRCAGPLTGQAHRAVRPDIANAQNHRRDGARHQTSRKCSSDKTAWRAA
jgi:hypothetical protein